jgi:hypothetical protein
MGLSRGQHRGPTTRVEACSKHDGGSCPDPAQLADQSGHGRWRCADDREVRRGWQLVDARVSLQAAKLAVFRIHRPYRATERACYEITQYRRADTARPLGCTNRRDRARPEQIVKVAYAHDGCLPPTDTSPAAAGAKHRRDRWYGSTNLLD